MELVATCLFGLERLAGEDIDALGYKRLDTIDGRITFCVPDENAAECIAECNINFRYAERLYIKLGEFNAYSFEDLYQGTKSLRWEELVGKDDEFPVKGHSIKSKLYSVPDCQRIVKKAVVDRLSSAYGIKQFPESGIKYQIEFFILKDKAILMIDTSGEGLHKRGYRMQGNSAPLRETLAAAMVKLSRPRENVIIVDPMCGSGTIAIEAALLVTNTAPGINRSFASESFPLVPKRAWDKAREKARASVTLPYTEVYGYDVDKKSIDTAKKNASLAGVSGVVRLHTRDIKDFTSPAEGARGTVITNPPYGERLGDINSARELLGIMGKVFEQEIPKWQLYIISSDEQLERFFGRRSDKTRKLYNGMIKCSLYQYFRN